MGKKLIVIIVIVSIALIFLVAISVKRFARVGKEKNIELPVSSSGLASRAKDLELKGDLLDALAAYQRLIEESPNSSEVMNWQKKEEDINIKLLFSSKITPKSVLYEIKPGDTLAKIAREFKTTVDLIMKSNNLSSDKIVPARKVKVWNAPFSIVVDKSQNTLILKSDEEIIKTYIVSTGLNNSTPAGNFKITSKLINPTWFKAGAVIAPGSPDNVLGTRWLGFDLAGYGIHGTVEPKTLGRQVTQGCVRMSNPDVEEVYTIVPQGTEVTVID